jgi:hypothetical protein
MRGRVIAIVVTGVFTARSALPCAPAPPRDFHVSVTGEQALIVWDQKTRTQHFVRRASFASDAADFGFLVPTPSRPELAEAPDAVFDALEDAIQPEVIEETVFQPEPMVLLLFPFFALRSSAPPPQGAARVRVVEQKRVAGYDATVLEATDAAALLGWLAGHGYDARPELREWLQPYVQQRSMITAFKIARDAREKSVATRAVRMSFTADTPFFPYREPSDQREGPKRPRELFVYVVAAERLDGSIGKDGTWSRELLYAAAKPDLARLLGAAVPSVPAGAWLSAYRDRESPRPGVDDLFFTRAATQSSFVPAPVYTTRHERIPVPLDVIAGAVVGMLWVRRRRRRQSP